MVKENIYIFQISYEEWIHDLVFSEFMKGWNPGKCPIKRKHFFMNELQIKCFRFDKSYFFLFDGSRQVFIPVPLIGCLNNFFFFLFELLVILLVQINRDKSFTWKFKGFLYLFEDIVDFGGLIDFGHKSVNFRVNYFPEIPCFQMRTHYYVVKIQILNIDEIFLPNDFQVDPVFQTNFKWRVHFLSWFRTYLLLVGNQLRVFVYLPNRWQR